jgi:hypothetical protein
VVAWRKPSPGRRDLYFTDLPPRLLRLGRCRRPTTQLTPGSWTLPAGFSASPIAEVHLVLGTGEIKGGADFGWDYLFLPVPEPGPTPAPTAAPTAAACTDQAAYVSDVTIPDGTWVLPGTTFDKVWRLRNVGTCYWSTSYKVSFVSGASLGGTSDSPLPGVVAPGETADVSVRLTAPLTTGSYRSNWMLRNPTGPLFGIGPEAASAFWVIINVGDTSTGAGPWQGEYFNNRTLSGSPALTRQDPVIDFNWGGGSPAAVINPDDFSARWTANISFKGGTYEFRIVVDDGARLFIDGVKVLDEWRDGASRERSVEVPLVQGTHSLRFEYYERSGSARVELGWEPVTSFDDWKGEYFTNRQLSGAPALVRNDEEIDFNWKQGSPATGLPSDNFSARWTRKITFEAGRYQLSARADDGIRIFINGGKVLDEWHDSSGTEVYTVDLDLSKKTEVVIEYYERSGNARVEFSPRTPIHPHCDGQPDGDGQSDGQRDDDPDADAVSDAQPIDDRFADGQPDALAAAHVFGNADTFRDAHSFGNADGDSD